MNNIFKIFFLIIGTIIGAGFISGQEIYLFFNSFGIFGIFGIIISSLILSYIIYKVLKITFENNIKNYMEFLNHIINVKNKFLKNFINSLVVVFLLITFYIMISGFISYFVEELNVYWFYGYLIISALCFFSLKYNVEGIIKVNQFLVPILIILVIYLFTIKFNQIDISKNYIEKSNFFIHNFFISGIIYATYNSIILIPVLITVKKYLINKKHIVIIAILSFLTMIVLSTIIYLMIYNIVDIKNIELPIIYIIKDLGLLLKAIGTILVLFAILTSAVATGYGFLENTSKNKKTYMYLNIFICVSAIIFAKMKFSGLLSLFYPIFGYLGLSQVIYIIKSK